MDITNKRSDILLSYDTDIAFANNDLMITSGTDLIKRKIFKLLITAVNDWKFQPTIGSSPSKFVGEKNTRDTGKLIEQYITYNIEPHIFPNFIQTKVVPVNYNSVKVYIDVYIAGLLSATLPYSIDFVNGLVYTQFDSATDTVISSETTKINAVDDISTPNIYKDRLRFQ